VFLNNVFDVLFRFEGIPNAFGIHDHNRAQFTPVQTTGSVDPNVGDAICFGKAPHMPHQFHGAFGPTAGAAFAAIGILQAEKSMGIV
jgi:hypothetical protein